MVGKSLLIRAVLSMGMLLLANQALGATHTIVIEGMKYNPESLSAKVNDTIVWINKDFFPHTVTTKVKGFDSKEIESGSSWKYTVKNVGSFQYICTLHPTMEGFLKIK